MFGVAGSTQQAPCWQAITATVVSCSSDNSMVSYPSYSLMQQILITKMLKMSPRADGTCITRMPQMMRMRVRRLQYWPQIQAGSCCIGGCSRTGRCSTRRDSCTEKAAEAPVLAYRIWPIPTMSETFTSIEIVLSSHPPDLRAHEYFCEPVLLFDGW